MSRIVFASFSLLAASAVGACGGDPTPIVDAGVVDAPLLDGELIDAPGATVRITVTDHGAPVADVPVYFQDADDSLVLAATTSSTGQAETVMAAGGSVTALLDNGASVRTYRGVKPGDRLQLEAGTGGTSISFDLVFPASDVVANYPIYSTCGENNAFVKQAAGTPVTATVFLYDCPPRIDFLIVADDGGGAPTALYAPDVAVADGVAVTLTGSYQPTAPATVSVSNLDTTGSVELTRALATPRGVLWRGQQTVDVVAGAATATFAVPAITAVGATTTKLYGPLSNGTVAAAPTPGDYALDAATAFLPAFTTVPQFDQGTATVTWTETAAGAAPDLAYTSLSIFSGTEKRGWSWQIVGPHAGPMLTLPVVPTDLVDVNPGPVDSVSIDYTLTAKGPGGYDALRPVALSVSSLEALAIAHPGQLAVEESAPQFFKRR
ncbi:MAG: hypothetical protein R3B06_24005 [Kofleriaceae bacterium]